MTVRSQTKNNPGAWLISVWVAAITSACTAAPILDHDRMQGLPGAGLLGLRVNTLFDRCGLPSTINDAETDASKRRHLDWRDTPLTLSDADWAVSYAGDAPVSGPARTWVNPRMSDASCRDGAARLVLIARGKAGMLRTTPRPDGQGYETTYDIPNDLLAAHRVSGVSAELENAWTKSELERRYGLANEVLESRAGATRYRYWVSQNRDGLADLLYAVDFEYPAGASHCARIVIQDESFPVVEKHKGELWRDWERGAIAD
jgi:hypothetical protein